MPFPGYNAGGTARAIGDRFEWSLMTMPTYPKTQRRAYDLHSEGWVVPKATQKRNSYEAALKYALSFYSDPVQREVALQGASLPVVRKWIASPEFTKGPPATWTSSSRRPTIRSRSWATTSGARSPTGRGTRPSSARWTARSPATSPARDALAAAVKAGDAELAKA